MDIQDVIQSFIDGEPVDPVELEQALADPDGRAHLIDLVVLRKLVKRSHAAVALAAVPAGEATMPARQRNVRWLAAAAAVAMVASAGGYFYGERASTSRAPIGIGTEMDAATPPISGADTFMAPTMSPAPSPTVVIRFQPGVDWTERGGY